MNYLYRSWQTVQELLDKFFVFLPRILLGIVAFAIFWFLAVGTKWTVERLLRGYRRAHNVRLVMGRLSQVLVLALGVLVAVTVAAPSFHTSDLIKVLGIGGIAIGFAFREILQNFLAGILLLLHEPFRIGDQIKVDEFEGTVEGIETRSTTLKTYDGRRVVIPNIDLFTKPVTVHTAYSNRRCEYTVGIGYGDNLEQAKSLILEAVRGIEGVLSDPAPGALASNLGDSSVDIKVQYWIKPPDHANVLRTQDAVVRAIKNTLSDAGIDMPYPTSQILFHDQTEDSDGDRSRQREGWPAKNGATTQTGNIASALRQLGHSGKHDDESHSGEKAA